MPLPDMVLDPCTIPFGMECTNDLVLKASGVSNFDGCYIDLGVHLSRIGLLWIALKPYSKKKSFEYDMEMTLV